MHQTNSTIQSPRLTSEKHPGTPKYLNFGANSKQIRHHPRHYSETKPAAKRIPKIIGLWIR